MLVLLLSIPVYLLSARCGGTKTEQSYDGFSFRAQASGFNEGTLNP